MTDVRLTATDPSDSSVVPVACNAKGELLLEQPDIPEFDGTVDGDLTVNGSITAGDIDTGSATFGSAYDSANSNNSGVNAYSSGEIYQQVVAAHDASSDIHKWIRGTTTVASVKGDGSIIASGEVTVTSRSQKYVLTEQGGLCHMVAASSFDEGFEVTTLRDVFKELDDLKELVQTLIKSRNEKGPR